MAYPYDYGNYMPQQPQRNMYQQPQGQYQPTQERNMNNSNIQQPFNYSYGNYSPYPNYMMDNGMYQQRNNIQPQQPQTIYHPLTYVSGIEGAKAFIVNPNQKVFLLDSETNEKLFIKTADNEGKYSIQTYFLTLENNQPKEDKTQPQNFSSNVINEEYLTTYVGKEINQLETKFKGYYDNLNKKLDSLQPKGNNKNNNYKEKESE